MTYQTLSKFGLRHLNICLMDSSPKDITADRDLLIPINIEWNLSMLYRIIGDFNIIYKFQGMENKCW